MTHATLETLNLEEASRFLCMSAYTLREKAKQGVIPGAKAGKRWVFIKSDLAAYIRSRYSVSQQALQVSTKEKSLCYTNATMSGGSDLQSPTEHVYDALLKPAIK